MKWLNPRMRKACRPASTGGAVFRSGIFFLMMACAAGWAPLPAGAEVTSKPAPEFSLPDLNGGTVGLEHFRGKYLVLNFWATWCGPCKVEMPSLEALHRRFKGRPLTVVGVSNDMFGATVVKPYVKAQGLTFPILLDPKLEASNAFGVLSLPTTVLVDPEGRIIGTLAGAENWSDPETIAYFENLLKP